MKNLQDYLLIKEAAEVLGVTQQTLRNWEKAGKLRVYRNPVNGYRLFLKTDLEVILRKLERSASTNRGRRKT